MYLYIQLQIIILSYLLFGGSRLDLYTLLFFPCIGLFRMYCFFLITKFENKGSRWISLYYGFHFPWVYRIPIFLPL